MMSIHVRRLPVLAGLIFIAAGLSYGLSGHAAEGSEFEPLPVLQVSKIQPAKLVRGDHFHTEENVQNDGFMNTYKIVSDYGTFEAEGDVLLMLRIREIGALTQLKDVNEAAVAAGAVAASAAQMGKGVVNVATHPVETVEGVPGGVKRVFGKLGRSAKRTTEKVTQGSGSKKDKPADPNAPPTPSTTDAVASTAESAGKSFFGVNSAMRRWAQKVKVDPYTTNQVLRAELEHVASYDAAGRFATKLVPGSALLTAASTLASVNDLVYSKDPDELKTINEKRLKAMGVSGEVSKAFRLNKFLTPTWQTYIVSILDALPGIQGRPDFIDRAADADSETQAIFFAASAIMLGAYNRDVPVQGIMPGTLATVAVAKGNRLALLLPVDYVPWTERLAGHVEELTQRFGKEHPKASVEVWLTGDVSARTRQELEKRGWTLHVKKLRDAVLSSAEAPTPKPAGK